MEIDGLVQNGVVVLAGGFVLPEGTHVTVSCSQPSKSATGPKRRVALPLVPSRQPGTLELNGERIAELLEDADVSA